LNYQESHIGIRGSNQTEESLKIAGSIVLLLVLDLATKHYFRFAEEPLEPLFVFVEGHLYIESTLLNFGNGYHSVLEPGETSIFHLIMIYGLTFISLLGASYILIDRKPSGDLPAVVGGVGIVSGGLGNIIDRLMYGNVCDWITITKPALDHNFVFNIADIFLIAGLFAIPFTFRPLLWKLGGLIIFPSLVLWPMRSLFL
jgi:lipoprotein signal peptidase